MSIFGVPITNETLEAMSKYNNKTITQEDRAREAMRLIHAEEKNMQALNHVLADNSHTTGSTTLCLLYNATGATIELLDKKDEWGNVHKEEPPSSFENGQWLAFVHVNSCIGGGSCAARVYRGKNVNGEVRDFLVSWINSSDVTQNGAYTEVIDAKNFDLATRWKEILHAWTNEGGRIKITKDEKDEYCTSTVSIGGYTSAEFIAVLKHKFSPL